MRKLNLLVIDDEPTIVRLIGPVLKKFNLNEKLNVVTLTEPREALAWIQQNCCDILLSDIEMPGIDGLEILHAAKQRNSWTQTIFLTGQSTWDRIEAAIESGANDYLIKPLNIRELVDLLEQTIARFARWETAVIRSLNSRSAGAV